MDVGDAVLTTCLYKRDGQPIEIIHFAQPASPPRPYAQLDQLGLSHLTVEVADRAATATALRDAGVVVRDEPECSGTDAFLFEDPEGNLIRAVAR